MQRHPEITVRLAQNISHARAQCMNRPMVHTFFNMYEQEVDELVLRTSPHAIYNADETGLQLHLRPGRFWQLRVTGACCKSPTVKGVRMLQLWPVVMQWETLYHQW